MSSNRKLITHSSNLLKHRYLSQKDYDDLLRGCPEASILIETTGTWKTGHIRKRVTDSRWRTVDIYNGQFLKHEDHDEIWFDLGSVRYVVDRCDECVDETPCLTFATISNSSHLRSDAENVQSYVCGMSSAYVALTEIVSGLNGNNWASMSHVYHVAARSKNVLVLSSCESVSVLRYALFHVALGLVDNNERTLSSLEIAFSNANARSRCNTLTSSLAALVEKLFLDVSIFERYPEHEKTFDTIVLTDDRSFHHDEYNILRAARYLIVSKRHVWFSKDENDDVLSSVPSYSVEDPPFEFRGDAYRSGDDDTELFVVLSLFEEGR